MNRIPDEWGTAVNVQQMVFGNKGETSATGVAFSRDEVTGAPEPSGDFLVNAQGEDVVAGVRTPRDLHELADVMPDVNEQLMEILRTLEAHYKDMQDTEFTVEEGRLYMLQTRNAKRPAQAAVRFAVDAVDEGLLTRREALATIDAGALDALLHPTFDRGKDYKVLARGVAASPGAACGEIVFERVGGGGRRRDGAASDPGPAVHRGRRRRRLPRRPGDPHLGGRQGLARGARGAGDGSAGGHRRGRDGRPARRRAADRRRGVPRGRRDRDRRQRGGGGRAEARRWSSRRSTSASTRLLGWADELRRLRVRANADTPRDAARARELGAEGIGLCRTEHMFMAGRPPAEDARDDHGRGRRGRGATRSRELLPLQESDFKGIFEAMRGLPVTIRLLDPPLHEFLPDLPELRAEVERARIEELPELAELERRAGARGGDPRGQPDARNPRLPARDPLPRDLRDAGRGDRPGRAGGRRAARTPRS